MLYPLKFRPLYKEKIWGGQSFKQIFDKDIPFSHTGEVWNVACHNRGMSIVSEGRLKDKSLQYIFENFRQELIGASGIDFDKFPLLILFILGLFIFAILGWGYFLYLPDLSISSLF